jgi:cellulose synthase/poly-beta-1,6-N-acetylglucosamine synthase-like glycosyltransferase
MEALFESLSILDYPKHKLDGILLVEADDEQTKEAIEEIDKPGWISALFVPKTSTLSAPGSIRETQEAVGNVGKPGWLKVLDIPPGEPRTKPKAMIYGLLYARGDLVTVYDAEDQPDPRQLKEAVWAFKQADDSVVCLQAKLNYYNARQNLLTRWFTLEYSAWFDLFLPGLHRLNAPIPLGGTSNHFRADVLRESLSWDPYNVTEDADLGLRFARLGKTTRMLDSTTYEEANSKLSNWLRQRSRWIKGYMQTFLVHTRNPLRLRRDIGTRNFMFFMATIGGLIYTVLISPVFWVLLILWLLFQPGWIPELFPGPVYYIALINLLLGNFFFVFLGLAGAVGRGYDDLAPHTLLVPIYWLLMSVAGYVALYELITKPYYWQKTEHGLHFEEKIETHVH